MCLPFLPEVRSVLGRFPSRDSLPSTCGRARRAATRLKWWCRNKETGERFLTALMRWTTSVKRRGIELLLADAMHQQAGGGVRLTWRMTTKTQRQWRYQIRSTGRARRAEEQVAALVRSLYQTPGFHTTRYQVGKLVTLLRAECERSGRNTKSLTLPGALPYVRRMADESFTLDDWLASSVTDQHDQRGVA
jgi:hypothetical protein